VVRYQSEGKVEVEGSSEWRRRIGAGDIVDGRGIMTIPFGGALERTGKNRIATCYVLGLLLSFPR
jgi:hypothetical protein